MTDVEIMTQALSDMKKLEEKFRKIQENPALYGAENGFTSEEMETLQKLIAQVGEANLAADTILQRARS